MGFYIINENASVRGVILKMLRRIFLGEGNGATLLDRENAYMSGDLTAWGFKMWYIMTCKDLLDE